MVSASAVEDLWSSPFSSTSQTSSPPPGQEVPRPDTWAQQLATDLAEDTQAMPAVETSALEPEPDEFLPIFAAVGSDWFRGSDAGAESEAEPLDSERRDRESAAAAGPRPLEPRVRRPGPHGLETRQT